MLRKTSTASTAPVQVAGDLQFEPAPLAADSIIDGQPEARVAWLSESSDRMGNAMIWECTAGTFDWHFHFEETIHILSGEVIVTDADGVVHRLGAGDIAFFRGGSTARWYIPDHLRKLAFNRRVPPSSVMQAWRAVLGFRFIRRRLRNRLTGRPDIARPTHPLPARQPVAAPLASSPAQD